MSGLENDYHLKSRRSFSTLQFPVRHLRSFFGLYRAVNILADRVKAYQVNRLRDSAAPATINREVATLGRMLSLAVEAGKLSRKPKFKLLEGEKVRQGFLEHRDFLRLVDNLPDHLRDVIEFLYLSGWRKGEALTATGPVVRKSFQGPSMVAETDRTDMPMPPPVYS